MKKKLHMIKWANSLGTYSFVIGHNRKKVEKIAKSKMKQENNPIFLNIFIGICILLIIFTISIPFIF